MTDPRNNIAGGYGLFMEPMGALQEELHTVITKLSQEYGGPVFSPHITLLSYIDTEDERVVIEKATQVASGIAPLTITLGALASEDAYFRSLYSTVVEQEMLKAWHARAAETFDIEPSNTFLAHLSLLYGNYPEEQKAQTRASLTLPEPAAFIPSTLSLYSLEGRVEDWRKIQEFPLVH